MTKHRASAAAIVIALTAAACGGAGEIGGGTASSDPVADATARADIAIPTPDPTPTGSAGSPEPTEPATGTEAAEPTASAEPTAMPTPDPSTLTVEIPTGLRLELTPLLDIAEPIAVATRAGTDNLYLATKGGRVVEVAVNGDEADIVADVLDVTGRVSGGSEQGLLGIAFSPEGSRLFVNLTDRSGDTNIISWAMDGAATDPDSEQLVLAVDQPRSNHNGGDLTFGPDGYLYIGLGDGGGAGDPFRTGQDPFSLLATIVRIDPTDAGYAVPPDNPFVDGGGAPEVYIWGARNPWRFSFDRLTGDLWIADVGQDNLEEVNVLYANTTTGTNLGWPDVEGNAPFAAAGPPTDNYTPPIYTYGRNDGCSVTGGYIYRGTTIAQLQGHYIFGDYCTSTLWALATSQTQGLIDRWDLGIQMPESTLGSFGEGPDGEIYVLGLNGTLYRLDPSV